MSVVSPGVLILVCGLPGAGKTTFAQQLETERNAIRLCPDDWIEAILEDPSDKRERDRLRDPVENLQWELCQSYLKKGLTVILENGFWAEEERSLYAMAALELGASIELFYLDVPSVESLWRRVSIRNERLESTPWVMTRDEIDSAWKCFQAPSAEELSFFDHAEVIPWRDSFSPAETYENESRDGT